ncbi:uncharacterized, partial [Tachysurus ichikawai]
KTFSLLHLETRNIKALKCLTVRRSVSFMPPSDPATGPSSVNHFTTSCLPSANKANITRAKIPQGLTM